MSKHGKRLRIRWRVAAVWACLYLASATIAHAETGPVPPIPDPSRPAAGEVKSDLAVYPEPDLPSLPEAGATIVDPVFGTRILRVTDASDGSSGNGVFYSYYPTFNKDNTYLVVRKQPGSIAKFFVFDQATFTAGPAFYLERKPVGLQQYAMSWSGVSPHLIYGVGEHNIYEIDVRSQRYRLVKDLSAEGEGGLLTQMLKSQDDDVFALSILNKEKKAVGYVVYRRSTDRVLVRELVEQLDEVQVDKTGRYLTVVLASGGSRIYNLMTEPVSLIADLPKSSGVGFNHHDSGRGTVFTGAARGALGLRSLAEPTTVRPILPGFWEHIGQQDHYSFLGDDETWGLVSRYSISGGPVVKPFDNELVLVATDGSNRIRRIAHHRSIATTYEAQPKATISRDGRYIAFTSNWGKAKGRTDVYIAEVPPAK